MSVYVVDASIAAKWFLNESHAGEACLVLHSGHELHAPDFLLLEMDSLLAKHVRRGNIVSKDAADIRNALRRFDISYHSFPPLLDDTYELADAIRQSPYDCLYVVLAILIRGRMVTADRKLYDALARTLLCEHVLWVEDLQ